MSSVEIPENADYYYCPVCDWTADEAPLNGDWMHGGASSTDSAIVECGHCQTADLLVDLSDVDGYVETASVVERLLEETNHE